MQKIIMLSLSLWTVIGNLGAASSNKLSSDEQKQMFISAGFVLPAAILALVGQPVTSMRNTEDAKSLVACSADEFKAVKNKAMKKEAMNTLARFIALVASSSVFGIAVDKAGKDEDAMVATIVSLVAGVCSTISLVKSYNVIKRYKKQIQHAEMLYELLQSDEFKERFEVDNWESVKNTRQMAEKIGSMSSAVAFLGALGLGASYSTNAGDGEESWKFNLMLLSALCAPSVVKPLVSAVVRRKTGAAGIEDAFDQAIQEKEKEGKPAKRSRRTK